MASYPKCILYPTVKVLTLFTSASSSLHTLFLSSHFFSSSPFSIIWILFFSAYSFMRGSLVLSIIIKFTLFSPYVHVFTLIRCYLALHAFLPMLKLLHSGFCLFHITEPGLQKIFTFSYLKTPAKFFFNPYDTLTTPSFKGSLAIFCPVLWVRTQFQTCYCIPFGH